MGIDGAVVLAAGWLIYCFLHSFLATEWAQSHIHKIAPPLGQRYRLYYNIFAVVTLIPVVYVEKSLGQGDYFDWGKLETLRAILFYVALILFIYCMRVYDWKEFIGLKAYGPEDKAPVLYQDGALGIVRHPLYALAFPLLWTRPLTEAAIATNFVLTIYLIIGTRLEEKKLVILFGEQYEEYQQKVPAFIPWRWVLAKLGYKSVLNQ